MTPTDTNPPASEPADTPSPDTDWAQAMAEQQGATAPTSEPDPWAEALAEQAGTPAAPTASPAASPAASAAAHVFKPLGGQGPGASNEIGMIMDVPVRLSVELGRTQLTIKNLLQLGQGSVVELDGLAGEPMDIFVNGYLIAQGEVVVVEDKYGIRLTDIITPSERLNRLNTRR